ncbi:MAG TPA: Uma2 family endonuclease [Methylomirabilota bacterium]|jgi:Uma2 family endonuclease|nr:Uma2 family endonuclease [Methylomirabilota bacterium]
MAIEVPARRFTVDEYHRMGDAGILGCEERLELIAGQIVVCEPIGFRHASVVDRLAQLWFGYLGRRANVRVQNPVTFPEADSELQPDILLLRARDDFYATGHPRVADVLLLIEVADTTVRLDRRVKIPLYAAVGVGEVWLCDLVTERVEVYREPAGETYRDVETMDRGQTVSPLALPDVTVAIDDLLGPTAR